MSMNHIRSFLALLGACAVINTLPFSETIAQQSARRDSPSEQGASITYHVTPVVPSETFEIGAKLNNISGDTVTFHFPIWGPGAYDIVNFGAYVSDFIAMDAKGKDLKVVRSDTNTFKIIGGGGKMEVRYKVDDIENTPNSLWFGLSDIEHTYAFANTPALFGYPVGYKDIPYRVVYNVPKGWDIAIGLDPAPGKNSYSARDYDELVDAPVTMGKFQRLEFNAKGKPHVIAIFAPDKLTQKDANELVTTTKRIVEVISDFFGEMPYDRYIFQHFLVPPADGDAIFGALEHRNSSTYRMPLYGSPAEMLRAVIAHEYWHLWSPKRIHVHELGPFDYQRAPRTNSLWFAEGLTEYYAQVLLARHGFTGQHEMLRTLNSAIDGFYKKKQVQTISELSLNIAEVKPSEIYGLYTKGPVLGLLLDAAIRAQTSNAKSLDDVMRHFNEVYGKTGKSFADEEIIPIMEKATGAKLADFYNRYITGVEALPFDEYFPKIGLKLATTYQEKKTLGAELEMTEKGWVVASIVPDGSAAKMGWQVGDRVKAIQFQRNTMETTSIPLSYADVIATMRDVKSFEIVRSDSTLQVAPQIVMGKVATYRVAVDESASPLARTIRKQMFGF